MKSEVVIVDYGLGNILSIGRALEHVGASVKISSSHSKIVKAKRIVLPGVGAFPRGMKNLINLNLDQALMEAADSGVQILGICLGMQLLFEIGMEHEETRGLGLLPGAVDSLMIQNHSDIDCVVPSVGWMRINTLKSESFVTDFNRKYFYFVHSFSVRPNDKGVVVAEYKNYGGNIVAAVQKGNVSGVQFHPEKSGREGLALLENWINF